MDNLKFEEKMRTSAISDQFDKERLRTLNHTYILRDEKIRNGNYQAVIIIEELLELTERILEAPSPKEFLLQPYHIKLQLIEELADSFIVIDQMIELFDVTLNEHDLDILSMILTDDIFITILPSITRIVHTLTKTLRGKDVNHNPLDVDTRIWDIHIVYVGILKLRELYGISENDFYKAVNIKIQRGEERLNKSIETESQESHLPSESGLKIRKMANVYISDIKLNGVNFYKYISGTSDPVVVSISMSGDTISTVIMDMYTFGVIGESAMRLKPEMKVSDYLSTVIDFTQALLHRTLDNVLFVTSRCGEDRVILQYLIACNDLKIYHTNVNGDSRLYGLDVTKRIRTERLNCMNIVGNEEVGSIGKLVFDAMSDFCWSGNITPVIEAYLNALYVMMNYEDIIPYFDKIDPEMIMMGKLNKKNKSNGSKK